MIKENDSFPIRQLAIRIPQANTRAQTYSQLKVGVGHTVEMFFLKVNLLGVQLTAPNLPDIYIPNVFPRSMGHAGVQ